MTKLLTSLDFHRLFWTCWIGMLLICVKPAKADFYLHDWERHSAPKGNLLTDLKFDFYSTNSNFNVDGDTIIPSGLDEGSIKRLQLDLPLTYGVTEWLSLFARMTWIRNSVDQNNAVGTAFGLGDQSIGAHFTLFEAAPDTQFGLQVQYDFPLYSNQSAQEDNVPYLGDEIRDLTLGGFFSTHLATRKASKLSLVLGGGITFRSSDFSNIIPWSLNLQFAQKRGLFFQVGTSGLHAVRTGDSTDISADQNPCSNSGIGGSCLADAKNPSLIRLQARIGAMIQPKVGLYLHYHQALWGKKSPKGTSIGVGATIHLGGTASYHESEEASETNRGFVNYDFKATVIRTNDRLNLVKINKGRADGVEVGDIFDIFSVTHDGNPKEAIARAKVTHLKSGEAALKITEYFKEVWIEKGFIAKRPLD